MAPGSGGAFRPKDIVTEASEDVCENDTNCAQPNDDWLEGCQHIHPLTQRRPRDGRGNGSGKGSKSELRSKLAARKGKVWIDHPRPTTAAEPQMPVVRINTTIGTNVKEERRYRERVREVTRIEEVSDTKDTLSFLRGSITVTTNEYGVGDGR